MATFTFSSKLVQDGYTVIDNVFFNEFLPGATGDDIKVYLYGLSLCNNPESEDNSLTHISKMLSISEANVKKAFSYWQDMGLVQIVSKDPFEVRYLKIKTHSGSVKIRDKGKYADFNKQMQDILSGRMITPLEYNEYYSLIETYHFEPEAVLLIAKYCTFNKTTSISYPYILAVARDFARENLKTFQAVEEKFLEQEKASESIEQILLTLGLKRKADIDERNMFLKWTKTYGFDLSVILAVAKKLKKRGGFPALDNLMQKYFEMRLMSVPEIENYSALQEELYSSAKSVSKLLGLVFQDYENVVQTYISDWSNKGYDSATLDFIANYCFRQSVRTLEGMNTIVQKFYKLGLVSTESIEQYIGQIIASDSNIKEVLETAGLIRSVSSFDRDFYKTWTDNWGYSHAEIIEVAKYSKGKSSPMPYINKVIANLFSKSVHGEKEIKKQLENTETKTALPAKQTDKKNDFEKRNYTSEELSAVFDSLDDVEL